MSRSVLVTGGNTDIGQAIARRLAAQDDWVALTHHGGEALKGTLGVRCDAAEPAQVASALAEVQEAHGPIEVLVANADVTREGLLGWATEAPASAAELGPAGRPTGAVRALRALLATRSERIILVAPSALDAEEPGTTGHATAEIDLGELARSIARDYGRTGATVNIVVPARPGLQPTERGAGGNPVQIPAGHQAAPEEIAATVAYLASPEASHITASVIPVDAESWGTDQRGSARPE
ncbi:SDR family oxidoreductase [Streptomyces chryseus]